jgi:hypothetical protein
MRSLAVAVVLLSSLWLTAQEPMCGSSPQHDRYLEALHARTRESSGVSAFAGNTSTLRDGAFYLPADETMLPGYRPFDLQGQSLVFEPLGGGFVLTRTASQYVRPSSAAFVDFFPHLENERFITRDLGITIPIFGHQITRIYITAHNEIRFEPPASEQSAIQFGAAEALVQTQAVVSPLVLTTARPKHLDYPKAYVEETATSVRVTWRVGGPDPFGFDVQAELRTDGTIVFSYGPGDVTWGAPLITSGFDADTRTAITSLTDAANDVTSSVTAELRPMLDIRGVETFRINGADVFSVRAKLGAAPDVTKLAAGDAFRYLFVAEDDSGYVDIDRNGVTVTGFGAPSGVKNGITAKLNGDTIEMFGPQRDAGSSSIVSVRVLSYLRSDSRALDATSTLQTRLDPAPKRTSIDLSSAVNGTTLQLPIVETFVLAPLDVYAVWDRLNYEQKLSEYDIDGVAIYQSFYTDIIFYAGAYSTRGNPAVDGISPGMPPFRQRDPRFPALMHMNQLTYSYSSEPQTASKVLMHEFGHRWLYFVSIAENGIATRSLNPTSSHPAGYVHTPSAFPVYGENESSVMGGAYFAPQSDGSYKAHAANMGYSWTDLYLMGLAAPSEVPNWFYLAGTILPTEYWPVEGSVVSNPNRKDVAVTQIIDAMGPRSPSNEISQRTFRLLFVLVTEAAEPTAEEIAKVNEWRALIERNFSLATGGRAKLVTTFARPSRSRVVR